MSGYYFEYFFTTAGHGKYDNICSINTYDKSNAMCDDSANIGDGRPIIYGSTTDDLGSLLDTINFINILLQPFETN